MCVEQFNEKRNEGWCSRFLFAVLMVFSCQALSAQAADRTTFFVPRSSDAAVAQVPPEAVFPDEAVGAAAGDGWKNYMRLWRAHHDAPNNKSIRQYLGLPLTGTVQATTRRGRSAPKWMKWRPGTYEQISTPHFSIFSHADRDSGVAVAEDLERCYWIWTQMFFPHWEANAQVTTTLSKLGTQDVARFLESTPSRITIRRKLRVVLFRDATEYQETLGPDTPGIERSTGFYNDDRQTIFLYASDQDDKATRRHELVHQLFREATRSTLGRKKPGEHSDFWIVEGIAGYFESLRIDSSLATVGGWDASRLQFARYRMLVGGDLMPINELRKDGRLDAQKRQDIARWYAHAIAQTHHLMDSGNPKERIGMYQLLGREYAIKSGLSGGEIAPEAEQRLRRFLAISDDKMHSNPIQHSVSELCLAGCQVSGNGLAKVPPSSQMRWLDLARLPIQDADVLRLVPDPTTLQQLTLEATKITNELKSWLGKARNLTELDLSFTSLDDSVVTAISNANQLELLWLTKTRVSDASIDDFAKLKKLKSIDLQLTKVTPAGISRLKTLRPDLNINPIEIRGR